MDSDVEHHGEVIRLLIMQGKCIVGWGSRTFRVCSYREEEIEVFLGQTINKTALSLVCVLCVMPTGSRPRLLCLSSAAERRSEEM